MNDDENPYDELLKKFVKPDTIFNTLTGNVFRVNAPNLGVATAKTATRQIQASHPDNPFHIPSEARAHANKIHASKLFNIEGIEAAEAHLQKTSPHLRIDKNLSNSESLVIHNPETGTAEIAFRGTDPHARGITRASGSSADRLFSRFRPGGDFLTDLAIYASPGQVGIPTELPLLGKLPETDFKIRPTSGLEQVRSGRAQIQRAKALYNVEHITGYSLGGAKAIQLGNEFNIPSTSFNPLIGADQLANTKTQHKVYRTTGDTASRQIARRGKNINVTSTLPFTEGTSNILGQQVKTHDLENFRDAPTHEQISNNQNLEIIEGHEHGIYEVEGHSNKAPTRVRPRGIRSSLNIPNIAGGFIGAGASYGALELLEGAADVHLNRYERSTIEGGLAGGITQVGINTFSENTASAILRNPNILTSVTSGGVGYLAGLGASELTTHALEDTTNLGTHQVEYASGIAGGIVGGAAAGATEVAVVAGLGSLGLIQGGAAAGSSLGPLGILGGAALGGVAAGVFGIYNAFEHTSRGLQAQHPIESDEYGYEHIIGTDEEVRHLLNHYNDEAHYQDKQADHERERVLRLIRERVIQLGQENKIPSEFANSYNPTLRKVDGRHHQSDYLGGSRHITESEIFDKLHPEKTKIRNFEESQVGTFLINPQYANEYLTEKQYPNYNLRQHAFLLNQGLIKSYERQKAFLPPVFRQNIEANFPSFDQDTGLFAQETRLYNELKDERSDEKDYYSSQIQPSNTQPIAPHQPQKFLRKDVRHDQRVQPRVGRGKSLVPQMTPYHQVPHPLEKLQQQLNPQLVEDSPVAGS